MNFSIEKSIEILERTPFVIEALLDGLSDEWLRNNEGENTWSPYDIVGHLIHGEKTDWMVRAAIILSEDDNKTFEPFDRFAQFEEDQQRPIEALLKDFKKRRNANLKKLKALKINDTLLLKEGIHPELGEVNLQQLLATWVVHDLGHIYQMSRVMAKNYKNEVGPWQEFLGILKK